MKLEALNTGLHISYSDTDSLVVNGVMPTHLIDPAKLGLLKPEHKIKEGYFVAPKILLDGYWRRGKGSLGPNGQRDSFKPDEVNLLRTILLDKVVVGGMCLSVLL